MQRPEGEHGAELRCRHRPGEQVPLECLDANPAEHVELLGGLDTLGDARAAHGAGHVDDSACHREVGGVRADAGDEPPVQLHDLRWQVLQAAGTYYFGTALSGTTATYGLFGVVLGLLVWLYLSAFTVVLCAEVNVVRARRLWPRSLLTPFTDDVHLTRGDRKAYESYAETERHKGFETVEVGFDQAPPEADPREERGRWRGRRPR